MIQIETMKEEFHWLEDEIISLEDQLSDLPEGNLLIEKNGKYVKWRYKNKDVSTIIKKENKNFAEQLARKKYLSSLLHDYIQKKKCIASYLKSWGRYEEKAPKLLTHDSSYISLLSPYFSNKSAELDAWAKEPYLKNPNYPEHCIYKCSSGNMVRSKSEVQIDIALMTHKIPYRYESPLQLNGITYYPDFTIRHPKTGKLFIWEHLGQMDNPNYVKRNLSKLETYIANGLIPSVNLILTFETSTHPLTLDIIEKQISLYFS